MQREGGQTVTGSMSCPWSSRRREPLPQPHPAPGTSGLMSPSSPVPWGVRVGPPHSLESACALASALRSRGQTSGPLWSPRGVLPPRPARGSQPGTEGGLSAERWMSKSWKGGGLSWRWARQAPSQKRGRAEQVPRIHSEEGPWTHFQSRPLLPGFHRAVWLNPTRE